jgi:hypothetical protein
MKVSKYIWFWTVDRTKCYFEFQIENEGNHFCVGAFGKFRQEAIREAKKKILAKFPEIAIPDIPIMLGKNYACNKFFS